MTNVLDALLEKVDDQALREQLAGEIDRLRSTRDFGLVFDRHIPERVRLYQHAVRRGCLVQKRATKSDDTWVVRRIVKGVATLRDSDGEETARPVDELVVVSDFRDPIYPGLTKAGSVERGGDKPPHIVINGENFHALEALVYAFAGMVDAVYIDPPYNSGARDWKYNNRYVDGDDRHSKWLSFMERRLRLAKQLLSPDDSVLIVTIDEKEVHRLSLLLEELFPEARVQMVSITISPRGTSRANEFSRVDEFAIFVFLGGVALEVPADDAEDEPEARWQYLRRDERTSTRAAGRPNQFFPIYVDSKTQQFVRVGAPLARGEDRASAPRLKGCTAVFPIRADGTEMVWGLTGDSLEHIAKQGFVRITPPVHAHQPYTISYLRGVLKNLASGKWRVTGHRPDGSKIVVVTGGKVSRPTTVWRNTAYDAGAYGTSLLRALIPGRHFPYPKSLYAVEDTLRFFLQDKQDALILDFFGGSGTTTHAVARLNRQDDGRRRSILVTNNEVSEKEATELTSKGLAPGDPGWESMGIFEHITLPRITAALTGKTPEGTPIEGDYKFTDEFAMSEGFEENVDFYRLAYLDPNTVSRGKSFAAIAPLLWLKAGGIGPMIEAEELPFAMPEGGRYAICFDITRWRPFVSAVNGNDELTHVYVVTDSAAQFQEVAAELSAHLEVAMLPESYLRYFELGGGLT